METPFLDRLIEKTKDHIEFLKDAESYEAIPEIVKELAEYEAIKEALATLHSIESLLSEENSKKMALEYTGAEEEYQGFILACGVIAEKISKQ